MIQNSGASSPLNNGRILVNDVHSQLNPTYVTNIISAHSLTMVKQIICQARASKQAISIAGGRHAMGGQQFAQDSVLLNNEALNSIVKLDSKLGLVEVESGINWRILITQLNTLQRHERTPWTIIQKPTGIDDITIGGTLSANAHGRGLSLKPIIADIESCRIVDCQGNLKNLSREENSELFRLVVGGYGLFGVVVTTTLRLARRQKLARIVEIKYIEELMAAFAGRIEQGFLYGDFQFNTDDSSLDFLRKGIFATYKPVPLDIPIPKKQIYLSLAKWRYLLYLAHTNKKQAFAEYADHYLSTSEQIYWSDTHQLSTYLPNYHKSLDKLLKLNHRATEIITELYLPKNNLVSFMQEAARYLRKNQISVIYGTIRLIERDDETFLPWAKDCYACVIFNLHTEHSTTDIEKSRQAFKQLINLAIEREGSFYLTYHRFADRQQVEACYPSFGEFLNLKRKYDPQPLFQSEWFRYYDALFSTP